MRNETQTGKISSYNWKKWKSSTNAELTETAKMRTIAVFSRQQSKNSSFLPVESENPKFLIRFFCIPIATEMVLEAKENQSCLLKG